MTIERIGETITFLGKSMKYVTEITFEPIDPLPPEGMQLYMRANHISSPYDVEFTQEMSIEEAKRRWPNTPIPGEDN